jgi:hypothetical protein
LNEKLLITFWKKCKILIELNRIDERPSIQFHERLSYNKTDASPTNRLSENSEFGRDYGTPQK